MEYRRAKVFVLFGNEAYYSIFKAWGITSARGMFSRVAGKTFVLALHPSYVLRSRRNPQLRELLVRDIHTAKGLARGR